MLAMADRKGRVWSSIPGLANRARIPLGDTETALQTFLSPDKYSRTTDFEGRRIEAIDGGWRLLNYDKYRATRDDDTRREQVRSAVAKHRANVSQCKPDVSHGKPIAEAEAEAEARKKKKEPPLPPKGDAGFDQFYKAYPKKKAPRDAEQAWKKLSPSPDLQTTILVAIDRAKQSPDWQKDGGQFIPYPASWLNGRRWEDEVQGPVDDDFHPFPEATQ